MAGSSRINPVFVFRSCPEPHLVQSVLQPPSLDQTSPPAFPHCCLSATPNFQVCPSPHQSAESKDSFLQTQRQVREAQERNPQDGWQTGRHPIPKALSQRAPYGRLLDREAVLSRPVL